MEAYSQIANRERVIRILLGDIHKECPNFLVHFDLPLPPYPQVSALVAKYLITKIRQLPELLHFTAYREFLIDFDFITYTGVFLAFLIKILVVNCGKVVNLPPPLFFKYPLLVEPPSFLYGHPSWNFL